ncbi:MAG: class I SAM-dependent methyltransferase [Gammaproteobacteria bacterium]
MNPSHLAAWLAFYRPSHRARVRWLVSLLDVQPKDDVLDAGFGSGFATDLLAAHATEGRVVGIDPSKRMLEVACRRLRRHLRTGRVTLVCAEIAAIPRFDVAFDRVLVADTTPFESNLALILNVLRARMTPGGRIALAAQQRPRGATAQAEGARLADALSAAGFERAETHFSGSIEKLPCICATAFRPQTT